MRKHGKIEYDTINLSPDGSFNCLGVNYLLLSELGPKNGIKFDEEVREEYFKDFEKRGNFLAS